MNSLKHLTISFNFTKSNILICKSLFMYYKVKFKFKLLYFLLML
jgi:hypothetical protein